MTAIQRVSGEEARKLLARARNAPGTMNGIERKYESHLQAQKLCGAVLDWKFQDITLKVGPDCRLTPDFAVLLADGTIALDDCKGTKRNKVTGAETYWAEEDAMVKIRSAAKQFPWFAIRVCWLTAQGWRVKEIA